MSGRVGASLRAYIDSLIEAFNEKLKKMLQKYITAKRGMATISTFLKTYFEAQLVLVMLRKRHKDVTSPFIKHTGACVPGFKLCVRTDGKIDACERVNPTMPVGNVWDGLDYEAIATMMTEYHRMLSGRCEGCIVRRTCGLCYSQCMGNAEFKFPLSACDIIRSDVSALFSIAYSLLEADKNAFAGFELKFSSKDPSILYL